MAALFSNQFVWIPVLAWAVAQLLKVLTDSWKRHRFSIRSIGLSGGMPSSHTAMTVCLTTILARRLGTGSPLFAAAAILTVVVVYDATGVRRAAGQQGLILNQMIEDLRSNLGLRYERVRELFGHTPFQVLAGVILGFVIGMTL
ncbi:MAG TPA: divergent PAP2 family protein [Candidatus Nanopelagicaceae bacterium]|nr:divergent PAP2 family protein [Candidatus Nanopelagicaceae bacterium]